jgi:hypothetical protein
MLYSEFRDGNVPAGHEQLRVMQDCLRHLPASVTKVSLRSDTAAYQEELLLYCGEGKDPRFGVIDFAFSADVTAAFRAAVLATAQTAWQPLTRMVDGKPQQTDQEWAEICFVPNWAGHSRKRADYRFLAIREPLRQLALGDAAQLPFPTQEFASKGTYKLFGVVTNRKDAGDQVIWWLRERCGKSEEVHSVMKSDPRVKPEDKPRRRATAVRPVRRQCRMVGLDDPGAQPECRDEATGAGQGLGDQADEGATLPADRFARARGPARTQADHSPGGGSRRAGDDRRSPSDDPGTGVRAGRMINRGRSHGVRGTAISHLIGRQRPSLSGPQTSDSRWLHSLNPRLAGRAAAPERKALMMQS